MSPDHLQPPHDTVDDVEPLCSACGGECGGKCLCAGNYPTDAQRPLGSGSPSPRRGCALFTVCECGDDCFLGKEPF